MAKKVTGPGYRVPRMCAKSMCAKSLTGACARAFSSARGVDFPTQYLCRRKKNLKKCEKRARLIEKVTARWTLA
jgi:hypothetical protein